MDETASLGIARQTGARFAVLGSAVAIGPAVRLVADVFDVEDGRPLGQRQVEGHPDSVLVLADRLAIGILEEILDQGGGPLPSIDLASITTASVPALKAYLEAEVYARRAQFDEAIEAYGRATEEDSTFALAHHGQASAHAWRENIQSASAVQSREAALRFVDRLPEREAALVRARHATGQQLPEALELLLAAVARHPADAEAWFLLGDVHLHTPALTGPEEADHAFQRAAELDPGFALYQPHGIELGFNLHADSSIAATRLEQYGVATNRGAYYQAGQFALEMVFGPPEVRAEKMAALDTVTTDLLPALTSLLQHPLYWEVQEKTYLALRDRIPSPAWRTTAADLLASGSLWKRGHLDRALSYLAHSAVSPVTRVCLPAVARGWGLPVPDDVLLQALSIPLSDLVEPVHFMLACQGYIAADLGRWDRHESLVSAAEERFRAARDAGDLDRAGRLEASAAELRGYALWRQNRADEALDSFEEAGEAAWYLGEWPRLVHKKAIWYPNIWPGQIHREAGDWERAAPYFRRVWYNPLAYLRLGQAHQAGGDHEAAREALGYFLNAWSDADPALQPWVDEGRSALRLLDNEPMANSRSRTP